MITTRMRSVRRFRALWRAFVALCESEAARTFGRALGANLEALINTSLLVACGLGLVYMIVRAFVSIRYGV